MYKEDLINTLEAEIIKHVDVETVAQGSEFDININGKTAYPYVFIETEVSNLDFGIDVGANTHNIALYFLDKHKEGDEQDIIDKQRVTEQIMYELLEYINDYVDGIYINGDALNAISLREFNSDVSAGWRLDVGFDVDPPLNRCDVKSKFV